MASRSSDNITRRSKLRARLDKKLSSSSSSSSSTSTSTCEINTGSIRTLELVTESEAINLFFNLRQLMDDLHHRDEDICISAVTKLSTLLGGLYNSSPFYYGNGYNNNKEEMHPYERFDSDQQVQHRGRPKKHEMLYVSVAWTIYEHGGIKRLLRVLERQNPQGCAAKIVAGALEVLMYMLNVDGLLGQFLLKHKTDMHLIIIHLNQYVDAKSYCRLGALKVLYQLVPHINSVETIRELVMSLRQSLSRPVEYFVTGHCLHQCVTKEQATAHLELVRNRILCDAFSMLVLILIGQLPTTECARVICLMTPYLFEVIEIITFGIRIGNLEAASLDEDGKDIFGDEKIKILRELIESQSPRLTQSVQVFLPSIGFSNHNERNEGELQPKANAACAKGMTDLFNSLDCHMFLVQSLEVLHLILKHQHNVIDVPLAVKVQLNYLWRDVTVRDPRLTSVLQRIFNRRNDLVDKKSQQTVVLADREHGQQIYETCSAPLSPLPRMCSALYCLNKSRTRYSCGQCGVVEYCSKLCQKSEAKFHDGYCCI